MAITPVSRAQGCLLGQLAGDSLGSLVEFQKPEEIAQQYPDGVRELASGGTFRTLAGQPTDDSEMALLLARSLVRLRRFDVEVVKKEYQYWLSSGPFDVGGTIASSLRGRINPDSQANGALMRVSPLGIFGAGLDLKKVAGWARADAAITHVHPVCQQVNALFVMAIATAIDEGPAPEVLFDQIEQWAREMPVEKAIQDVITRAGNAPPADFVHQMGWVLIAFQNALYQLKHAGDLASGVIDTVGRGGDTDTNAAIAGALLGAVYGVEQVPEQWKVSVLNCRPSAEDKTVKQPRPEVFWPMDALELAEGLLK